MNIQIIATVLIFLITAPGCLGETRCYLCMTAAGLNADKCGDDFRLTSDQASTCEGSCQKTRGLRSEGSRKVVEVTRGCVPYESSERCRKSSHLGISATVCTCNSYYCNSVSGLVPPTRISILLGYCLLLLIYTIL